MTVRIAVDTRNELGEGPIWHPDRRQLIWFDILGQTMMSANADGTGLRTYGFGEPVSAAFILDADRILVATASGLERVSLMDGARQKVREIEADNPVTRSNDCRTAPGGSLWFGTMGRKLEPGAGSFYHVGAAGIETLQTDVGVSNATCFSPAGDRAYFSDTNTGHILTCTIDPETGLPLGAPEVFVDLGADGLRPDGAVIDAEGALWNAQFGAGRVVRYLPDGREDRVIRIPATQTTCPAFGGADLKTLFVTTARVGLSDQALREQPHAGAVFAIDLDIPGQPERRLGAWANA